MRKVLDHLGNDFNSIKEMCVFYKVNPKTYRSRIKEGLSIEAALIGNLNKVIEYKGNRFKSIAEMCRFYGVNISTFKNRINKMKMSVEEALESNKLKSKVEVVDHLGNKFSTLFELCNFHGVNYSTFRHRIRSFNWSIEKALITPIGETGEVLDHLGNVFTSEVEMCQYYNISVKVYRKRVISCNWSVEKALTTSVRCRSIVGLNGEKRERVLGEKIIYKDHLDNVFNNKVDMCAQYGISVRLYRDRIEHGWSTEKALTTPVRQKCEEYKEKEIEVKIIDHIGKGYKNLRVLADVYNISYELLRSRLSLKYTLREALVTPEHNKNKREIFEINDTSLNSLIVIHEYSHTQEWTDERVFRCTIILLNIEVFMTEEQVKNYIG